MEKDVLSAIKCEFTRLGDKLTLEKDYGIVSCNDSIFTNEERATRKELQIIFLSNIKYLNYRDEYDREITNCDVSKIHEF